VTMESEHERLGRAPTSRELQSALAGTDLEGLSKDRLVQIKQNLEALISSEGRSLHFTMDRPLFRHLGSVRHLYDTFVDQHGQPPTFTQLKELLARASIEITETPLKNILTRLRKTAPSHNKNFRVSRQRVPVTTRQIEAAYKEAVSYLQKAEISKPPTAALVTTFLRRAGHVMKRESLEYRFEHVPELKSLSLSPHFDPGDEILPAAHKRLCKQLRRDPTAKELASEYNKYSLRRANADSVWTRVSRLNKKLPANRHMSFSDTFGSGIYDVDLKNIADLVTARLKRPPTLKELHSALLASVEHSYISADAVHRRSRRLRIRLTNERDLTKSDQLLLARTIKKLTALFGRRPSGAEVRGALESEGRTFSQKEFNTTLASAKKHRDKEFSAAVRLGLPGHFAGKMRQGYDALRRGMARYPTTEQLAKHLGWRVAGIESALPLAQLRAIRYGSPPIVLRNTPTAKALETLEITVQGLGGTLAKKAPPISTLTDDAVSVIKSLAWGWELPELPRGTSDEALTFDQKLARYEQWWVLITCLQAPPLAVSEEWEFEARTLEAKTAKGFDIKSLEVNPFDGFFQVMRIAQEAGRLSAAHTARVLKDVEGASGASHAYTILRQELMNLARQCGFPNPTNVRRSKRTTQAPGEHST
jgi:hypothetical protein